MQPFAPILIYIMSGQLLEQEPAGITAVAVLASQVKPETIIWIDPEFNVGRMGKYYRHVPGNLQTWRLITYAKNCPLFNKFYSQSRELLFTYNPQAFQPLEIMVDPLLDFTHYIRSKVFSSKTTITAINKSENYWRLTSDDNSIFFVKKIILAVGSHPKKLNYNICEIPLDIALDKESLAQQINPEDTIAVVGGMHSAFLVLKYLSELPVKKIINFYASDYYYGMPGTAGLEGITAWWAQNILEKDSPDNLVRVLNIQENRDKLLPDCTKIIYAIGYERNAILLNDSYELLFNANTGIIDKNLYGIGIAFPVFEILTNGKKVDLNGFNTYLNYAKKLIPEWINDEEIL